LFVLVSGYVKLYTELSSPR